MNRLFRLIVLLKCTVHLLVGESVNLKCFQAYVTQQWRNDAVKLFIQVTKRLAYISQHCADQPSALGMTSGEKFFVKVYCLNLWLVLVVIFPLLRRKWFFLTKRVIPYYAKVSSYQSSFTGKSTGLLIEHFDFLFSECFRNSHLNIVNL